MYSHSFDVLEMNVYSYQLRIAVIVANVYVVREWATMS